MDVAGVGEVDVEVVPAVDVHSRLLAPGGQGAGGMPLHDPVHDVDDVDVLLDQDVAGEHAVEDPVAHARLHRGHAGRRLPLEVVRVVVGLRANEVADGARVDAPDHLLVGRRVMGLEPHRHADLAHALASGLLDPLRAVHVRGHRLLQIDVLARGDRGLEVIGMPVGRARDEDGVHGRGQELVVRVRPLEQHRGLDGGQSLLRGQLVEPVLRLGQAVVEEVVQGDDARARVHQVLAHGVAAAAAPDDAQRDPVVGGGAEDGPRLDEHHSRGRRRGRLDELAPLHGRPPFV